MDHPNENMISIVGVFVFIVILIAILLPMAYQHFNNSDEDCENAEILKNIVTYFYVLMCCIPVALPTFYFMLNPRHLTIALDDLF